MLNEDQLNLLAEFSYRRIQDINNEYLEIMGNRIKDIGTMSKTDFIRLNQIKSYTRDIDNIERKLVSASSKTVDEINLIMQEIAKENYNFSAPYFTSKGIKAIPFKEDKQLQRYIESIARQTAQQHINLTQHTAFMVFDKNGNIVPSYFPENKHKMPTSLSDTYTKVIDDAVTKAQLGYTDYQSAMRETIKAMADSGIRTVDYATGYSRRLDTAVRQNILWGIKQCNQGVADIVGEEFGADGYEISYHSNPRPSHVQMGGKQYAKGNARTVKGIYYLSFSEVEGLLQDYNCLHFKFSILLGISALNHSDAELTRLKATDAQTFDFEGKRYTKYELSQLQRKTETAIRHAKDRQIIAKASGDDTLRREEQEKINLLTKKYAKLCKESGLPTKVERMSVSGFRKVKTEKELTKNHNRSIIKEVKRYNIFSERAVVNLSPKSIDTSMLSFDYDHINKERNHNIDEKQAVAFIKNAKISVTVWNGKYERYYSDGGATYVDITNNKIRTSFSSDEYDEKTKKLMEVLEKYGK